MLMVVNAAGMQHADANDDSKQAHLAPAVQKRAFHRRLRAGRRRQKSAVILQVGEQARRKAARAAQVYA